MRKRIFGLVSAAVICVSIFALRAWGVMGESVTVEQRISLGTGLASTYTILIDGYDLANSTAYWPHLYLDPAKPREINIDAIHLDWDHAAASSGTIKVGVVTYVHQTSGSVTWVWGRENEQNLSATRTGETANFWPYSLRCRVEPLTGAGYPMRGKTPYILSNDVTQESTVFQTDVVLPTSAIDTDGVTISTYPAIGDIILYVAKPTDASTTMTVRVLAQYHTESR